MEMYIGARFQVQPEAIATSKQAIHEFVDFIRTGEPGTHLYSAFQQTGDPTRFLHLFAFADAAARQAHRTSAAVRKFTGVLYPQTVDGVEFEIRNATSEQRMSRAEVLSNVEAGHHRAVAPARLVHAQ